MDINNQKLNYTIKDTYDTTTKGLPYYWNNTSYWQKEHLYDGKYSYASNADGRTTTTLFLFNASGSGNWARFLIDFGEEKEIKTINLWTGGSDKRQPHTIKIYRYSLEPDSTFEQNYIKTKDDSLPIIYEKTFTSVYTKPTKDTNYFIYPEDTKNPIISKINVTNEANILQVKANVVDPYYSSGIKEYRFALVKDNGNLSYQDIPWSESKKTNTIEYDLSQLEEGTYYIYVEATDNASNNAYKVSSAYEFSTTDINSQYIIMEIYDHLNSNSTVVTELEFYNSSNQKLTYDIPKVYDKVRNGIPYYWNSTSYWQKEHLYDEKTSYTSSTNGRTTSAIFNYSSTAGSKMWTRLLIDFGTNQNLKDLNIWLGGPEGRLPKEVHFYISEDSDPDTIYNQNIKVMDNTSLTEFANLKFSSDINVVTKFEKNNLKIYKFIKK